MGVFGFFGAESLLDPSGGVDADGVGEETDGEEVFPSVWTPFEVVAEGGGIEAFGAGALFVEFFESFAAAGDGEVEAGVVLEGEIDDGSEFGVGFAEGGEGTAFEVGAFVAIENTT